MAKQPEIRIMKRDIDEFNRLRRNYRAKVRRVKKSTGFELDDIDTALGIEYPDLRAFKNKEAFKTRAEFNQWKKKMQTVNSRNFSSLKIETNKQGMKYPKIIEEQGKQASKLASDKVAELIKQYENLSIRSEKGEELGKVKHREYMKPDGEMFGLAQVSEFDIDRYKNPESVEKRIDKDISRADESYYDERKERMRDNFASIFNVEDDPEKMELYNRLKQLDPEDFYELYLTRIVMDFEDWDSDGGAFIRGNDNEGLNIINTILDLYDEGNIDLSLKGVG